ncbi:hypothetical protein M1555_01155 [Patescibacteria group bacterium]|nr:hypothetical protein [Patescibacteria group bacterium]
MASLTETAYYTRRTINWLILAVIAYFLLRIFWSMFVAAWLILFPPKAPPPNHRFGKLPALVFPPVASGSAKLKFSLQTIQGDLPAASASANVYLMPKSPANLLAMPNTQAFAQQLKFDPTPIQDTKDIFHFNDPAFPLRTLTYNIVSDNFRLFYDFTKEPSLFNDHALPSTDEVKTDAIAQMQNLSIYVPDLKLGTRSVSFLRYINSQLMPATSLSQADAERIDFFRQEVGDTKILPPDPDEGSVYLIYSGSLTSQKQLIDFTYRFWPIDYETYGTYALKTSSQAWQDLQGGRGYIARYPNNGSTTVTVRNIYLAYYDSYDPETYLQPIFVFEGDYGFMAYVPAVDPAWTE